jgi:acyl-CoA synthetase (AMP-forming)/AMP-acid ligase II
MIAGDLLGERARLTPERTALVYVPTGERFTYAELDARAVRVPGAREVTIQRYDLEHKSRKG